MVSYSGELGKDSPRPGWCQEKDGHLFVPKKVKGLGGGLSTRALIYNRSLLSQIEYIPPCPLNIRILEGNCHAYFDHEYQQELLGKRASALGTVMVSLRCSSEAFPGQYQVQNECVLWMEAVAKIRQLRETIMLTPPIIVESLDQTQNVQAIQTRATINEENTLNTKNLPVRIDPVFMPVKKFFDHFEDLKATTDGKLKGLLLKIRIEINKKCGQVSNSKSQISNIVLELSSLFSKCWSSIGEKALAYCLVLFSEKILDQAESQVSLHPPSAFSYAQTLLDLGSFQPDLIPIFMYTAMKRCPYLVPEYSDECLEEEERQLGIIYLFSAVVQGSPSSGAQPTFSIRFGWSWLAKFLNLRPKSIAANVVSAFIETAGFEMYRVFGSHFLKLLVFIKRTYLPVIPLPEHGSSGSIKRLEIILDEILEKKKPLFSVPEGKDLGE